MTPAQVLRQAAQIMHDGGSDYGACFAIAKVPTATSHNVQAYLTAVEGFTELFSIRYSVWWFGNRHAQFELNGKAKDKAREHRTWALLLAACVVEDEQ